MTHSVVATRSCALARSLVSRSRLFTAVSLVVLPLFVACAGDLNSNFSQGGSSGSATGGATGTGGTTGGTGGSGANGTGGAGAGGTTAVACDALNTILKPKCSLGCHMPGGLYPTLDLSSDASASKAVGAAQGYPCAADSQSKIINTTAPVSGTLLLYVAGSTCGAGTQMPLGSTPGNGALTSAEIDCIKSYYTSKLK